MRIVAQSVLIEPVYDITSLYLRALPLKKVALLVVVVVVRLIVLLKITQSILQGLFRN